MLTTFRMLGLGIAVAAASLSCAGGPDDPSPTPNDSSPTPFIAEIDLAEAARLLDEGDTETATAIYAAGAERGTDDERRESLWALAGIYSSQGDHSAAEKAVEALQEAGIEPGREGAALLLEGRIDYAQGDFEEAEGAFREYVDAGGPAAPYAISYLSQVSRAQGDRGDAIALLDDALTYELPANFVFDSLIAKAELEGESAGAGVAVETLRQAIAASPTANQEAEALWSLAGAAEDSGDRGLAAETLQELVSTYPASYRSLDALSHPAGANVSQRDRALVLFRNRVNEEASTLFQSIAADGTGNFAEAQYHLGVLSERFERWDDAIAYYDSAITSGASEWYAAQATWDKATVLERLGRTDEAIAAYAAVSNVMPGHDQAGPGAFRAGLLSYQAGLPGDAQAYWSTFLEVAPNAEEEARANFWLAKTAESFGDSTSAGAYYRDAIEADGLDFHAFRARAIEDGADHSSEGDPEVANAAAWNDAEDWLENLYGPEDTTATDALLSGDRLQRVDELLAAGMDDYADAELRGLLDENAGDPWLSYRLIREIDGMKRYWVSSQAAWSLIGEGAPPALFQLVYPLPYLNLVQQEADANGFPPLLLLALMRQESVYQPDAVSSADAMGLTQVIPTTADAIAADLGESDFQYSDLTRPNVSLRFGAHYLGGVLEGFGGVFPAALSAYNGGPGNAGRWWEAAGGDPDLFVETIDYEETRAYVELVMENYALYRYAYGLDDEPVLPD
jgi:soluble lytic murein transglycosylase